jgi:hypothetical protein
MSHIPRDIVLPDQPFRQAARSGSGPASVGRLTKKTAVIAISGPPQVDRAELQLLGVHIFRYVPTILVAILLSAPLAAGITPFPASFHTQMVPTNGTRLYVRVGGTGPAVVLLHGFGFTGDMWAPLAIVLAKDHTVIVPDLRGMGVRSPGYRLHQEEPGGRHCRRHGCAQGSEGRPGHTRQRQYGRLCVGCSISGPRHSLGGDRCTAARNR